MERKSARARILIAGLAAVLAIGMLAAPALAAKNRPGGTTSSTIALVLMDGATEARFGARVTFDVATTATPYPYVHLVCRQDGTVVGEGRQGFFATAIGNQWFYLGPTTAWQGGAADCTATLEMYTKRGWSELTLTTFHVGA